MSELAYGWHNALVGRDPDGFARLFAADAEFIDVEHRTDDLAGIRPVVGRDAIRSLCAGWLEATPTFEYEVEEVLEGGSSVAVRWLYRVEGLELPGMSWLTVSRGEITRALVYFDSLGLYRGLGRV